MSAKLNNKDLKILRELEKDSRQSFNEIAKKTGMSKEVVLYRVRNMERSGVIRAYITHIDIFRLGYRFYGVLFKFEELSQKKEGEVIKFLQSLENIAWIARCEGSWDLNIVLTIRHSREVADFFNAFEQRFGDRILEKALIPHVSQDFFRRNFGLDEGERERLHTEEANMVSLSDKEEDLLKHLSRNARAPVRELAEKIKVSPQTVLAMLRRLEQAGVITGYGLFCDYRARGYYFYKLLFSMKGMEAKDWDAIYTILSFSPYPIWATRAIGPYDFSIELEVPDADAMRSFVGALRERFHDKIRKRETLLVYEEITLGYFPAVI